MSTLAPPLDDHPSPAVPSARAVAPRRNVPGGRALLGGLLVAVALIALFAQASAGDARPTTRYVVARHALAAGTVVAPGDLTLEPLRLTRTVAAGATTRPADVVGRTLLAPASAGQLLSRGALAPPGRSSGSVLSFALPPDRAVGGSLVAGDRIDVVATWSHEADAPTEVVAADVAVVGVRRPGRDALGSADQVTVTVRLPAAGDVLPLVQALRSAEVTLVRTTGRDGPGSPR